MPLTSSQQRKGSAAKANKLVMPPSPASQSGWRRGTAARRRRGTVASRPPAAAQTPPRPRDGGADASAALRHSTVASRPPAAAPTPPPPAGLGRRRCCGAAARYSGEPPPERRPDWARHLPRQRRPSGAGAGAPTLLRGCCVVLWRAAPRPPRHCWPLTATCGTRRLRGGPIGVAAPPRLPSLQPRSSPVGCSGPHPPGAHAALRRR